MNFKELKNKVLSWADDKDLLHSENADKQFMKFIEEVFEFNVEMVVGFNYIKQCEYIGTSLDHDLKKLEILSLKWGIFLSP